MPSSHRLANRLGVNAHSVQVMKASFYADEDTDMDTGRTLSGPNPPAISPS